MDSKIAVVVGGYLGDEGKGKATQFYLDQYADKEMLCVRSSGGTNTGATIYVDGEKLGIHMLPVGAFRQGCNAYIGNGCYVNLDILLEEMKERSKFKRAFGRVFLSRFAHIVAPSHIQQDKAKEQEQKG